MANNPHCHRTGIYKCLVSQGGGGIEVSMGDEEDEGGEEEKEESVDQNSEETFKEPSYAPEQRGLN